MDGDIKVNSDQIVLDAAGSDPLNLVRGTDKLALQANGQENIWLEDSGNVQLRTSGATKVKLDSSGKIGVNVDSPAACLQAVGDASNGAGDAIFGVGASLLDSNTVNRINFAGSGYRGFRNTCVATNAYGLLNRSVNCTFVSCFDRINGTLANPQAVANGDLIASFYVTGRNPSGSHTAGTWTKVEVDGDPSDTSVPYRYTFGNNITVKSSGYVGIGITGPNERLDVAGRIHLYDTSNPGAVTSGATIYAASNVLYASDSHGTDCQLTSHISPTEVCPDALSSYEDLSVSMPFSYHHKNTYMGKGQVIDMAKLVQYVEEKMQAEKGDQAGRLVYEYDLPKEECTTVAEHEEALINERAEELLASLEDMPWVKVCDAVGAIPKEAVDEIDETTTVKKTIKKKEQVVDFESMQMSVVEKEIEIDCEVPTGRKIKQFKEGWELRGDGLYRKPTLDDIDAKKLSTDFPQLPKWVLDRIQGAKAEGKTVSELVKQLNELLEARASQKSNGGVALAK